MIFLFESFSLFSSKCFHHFIQSINIIHKSTIWHLLDHPWSVLRLMDHDRDNWSIVLSQRSGILLTGRSRLYAPILSLVHRTGLYQHSSIHYVSWEKCPKCFLITLLESSIVLVLRLQQGSWLVTQIGTYARQICWFLRWSIGSHPFSGSIRRSSVRAEQRHKRDNQTPGEICLVHFG